MMESMMHSFKPIIIIIPLLLILTWTITTIFPEFIIELPFGVPYLHPENMYCAMHLFWLVVLPFGLVIGLIYGQIEKKKILAEKAKEKSVEQEIKEND